MIVVASADEGRGLIDNSPLTTKNPHQSGRDAGYLYD
jgi:hypothetical protein